MSFTARVLGSKALACSRRVKRTSSATALHALEALDKRIVPASLSVSDATIVEGNDGTRYAKVRVVLDAASKKTVTVDYETADGSASVVSDYGSVSGRLTFAPGERAKTIAVPVYGDRLGERDESFFVNLRGAKGARIADRQGVVTIVDDEPRITIEGVAWPEYSSTGLMPFVVRLSAPSNEVVTVNFATADGTALAGSDYVATSGTLTFAPGETTKAIYVEVFNEHIEEAYEFLYVNLSGATGNYFLDIDQAIGWIEGHCMEGCGPSDPGINP